MSPSHEPSGHGNRAAFAAGEQGAGEAGEPVHLRVAARLDEHGIPHTVLNAKPEYAEKEGEIVAEAGQPGAVTIATNMAGRGTDIKLGLGVIKCKEGQSHNGAYCPACPYKPDGAKVDAAAADPARSRHWLPVLRLMVIYDRAVKGFRWTVAVPVPGTMEI